MTTTRKLAKADKVAKSGASPVRKRRRATVRSLEEESVDFIPFPPKKKSRTVDYPDHLLPLFCA